jgi:hypothetical protein
LKLKKTFRDGGNEMLDAIANLNTAVSNRRFYPLESVTVRNAIDRLFTALSSFLDIADSVVLAESEKNLLLDPTGYSVKNKKFEEFPEDKALKDAI